MVKKRFFMLKKIQKQYYWPIFITFICIAINFFSNDSQRVEELFSTNFYTHFIKFYRTIFAWIPFSVGDVLYGLLFIYLMNKLFRFIKIIFNAQKRKLFFSDWKKHLLNFYQKLALIYLLFNLMWGINYNRLGITAQLNLKIEKYSLVELKEINFILVQKINENKLVLLTNKNTDTTNLFEETKRAYDSASKKYTYLAYENKSIKKSMYSWFCNYASIDGYYNPFTGEATVNTSVPSFTQPFTICHEVAHQLGYAKEMEANFVGYIAATSSNNYYFKYSTYADLFTYANNTLRIADSTAAISYRKLLLPEVIQDFKARRKFNLEHAGALEPFFRILYGKFLEHNQQPLGILSYDEVTAFIIAYHKKYNML